MKMVTMALVVAMLSGCQTSSRNLVIHGGDFRYRDGPQLEYWTTEELGAVLVLSMIGLAVIRMPR